MTAGSGLLGTHVCSSHAQHACVPMYLKDFDWQSQLEEYFTMWAGASGNPILRAVIGLYLYASQINPRPLNPLQIYACVHGGCRSCPTSVGSDKGGYKF